MFCVRVQLGCPATPRLLPRHSGRPQIPRDRVPRHSQLPRDPTDRPPLTLQLLQLFHSPFSSHSVRHLHVGILPTLRCALFGWGNSIPALLRHSYTGVDKNDGPGESPSPLRQAQNRPSPFPSREKTGREKVSAAGVLVPAALLFDSRLSLFLGSSVGFRGGRTKPAAAVYVCLPGLSTGCRLLGRRPRSRCSPPCPGRPAGRCPLRSCCRSGTGASGCPPRCQSQPRCP